MSSGWQPDYGQAMRALEYLTTGLDSLENEEQPARGMIPADLIMAEQELREALGLPRPLPPNRTKRRFRG